MCVFAPGAHPPVYVSVWLALDDCDAVNGCLEVCLLCTAALPWFFTQQTTLVASIGLSYIHTCAPFFQHIRGHLLSSRPIVIIRAFRLECMRLSVIGRDTS